MNKSESIAKIADALSKAQASKNFQFEGALINKIANTGPFKKKIDYSFNIVGPKWVKIFSRIAYGSSDCWYWSGRLNQHGYGTYNKLLAHRVVWTFFGNAIEDGKYLLHKCDVRNCVNPDHLYVGDQYDNMKDMMNRKRNANKWSGKLYENI